jgi:hypothetical protein
LPRIRDVAESSLDPEVGYTELLFLLLLLLFASLPRGKCQNIIGTLTQVTCITLHILCSCSVMFAIEKAVKFSMNKYMKKDKEPG